MMMMEKNILVLKADVPFYRNKRPMKWSGRCAWLDQVQNLDWYVQQ